MSFIKKFFRSSATVFVIFAVFLASVSPFAVFAATQTGSAFAGQVVFTSPCINLKDSLLVGIKNNNSQASFVYTKGVSRTIPAGGAPSGGQAIYGVSSPGQGCVSFSLRDSKDTILYYGTTTPTELPAISGISSASVPLPPGGAGAVSSGFGSLLSGSLGNLASQGLSSLANSALSKIFGGGIGAALGKAAGAVGGIGIFGGNIAPVMVCDTGILYMLVGTPYSGPLMYMPGLSSVPPYLYAMGTPPTAGPIIGHYSAPVPCVVGPVTIMVAPLMTGYGTGLP